MRARDGSAIDRRAVLRAALGLGLAAPLAAGRRVAPQDGGRTLVLVQLSGGNDGLSSVVPYADDGYGRARSTTRRSAAELLRLDEYRGLHPGLVRLRAAWDQGSLAIVEGVGYPQPNRSHFKSLDVWHAADRRGRSAGEGWIGRLCAAAFGDEPDPLRVVHVGGAVPYSLFSTRHPPTAFSTPQGFRWIANEAEVARVLDEGAGRGEGRSAQVLSGIRAAMDEARIASATIQAAAARHRPSVAYPSGPFGQTLRTVAALVHGELGCRVLSVELAGFDTHTDQRQRHDRLMTTLDEGLGAFLADLTASEAGRRSVVLVFSEFGRRVQENGSHGTDHGCAAPAFLAGSDVRGGLHGRHPSLEDLDQGDLAYTTDFRSIYAALIEGCFGIPAGEVLEEPPGELALLA
jgi:uncharacterized protein (DUF1501 family)